MSLPGSFHFVVYLSLVASVLADNVWADLVCITPESSLALCSLPGSQWGEAKDAWQYQRLGQRGRQHCKNTVCLFCEGEDVLTSNNGASLSLTWLIKETIAIHLKQGSSHQYEKNGAKWGAIMKRRAGEFYKNHKHEGRNVGLITKQAMTWKEH